MKNTFLGFIAISILSVSCKKDERPTYLEKEEGTPPPSVAVNNPPNTSLLSQAGIQPDAQNTPSATAVTAPGINPPHGQPGHRCDIPVGQPLSSAAAPTQAPAAQNITVNNNSGIQIDPNAVTPGKVMIDNKGKQIQTVPGMNPPHGEPGHRCDIPVGQPLNSKPAPAPQPAQNAVQTTTPPAPNPVEQNLAVGDKPKINPAHGEPWHNCSVKVGDPLP